MTPADAEPEVRTYTVGARTQVNAGGTVYTEGQTVELPDGSDTTALLAAGTIVPTVEKPARSRKR